MGFSKDFLWGAASAAHQVEGGYLDDGKGMGIQIHKEVDIARDVATRAHDAKAYEDQGCNDEIVQARRDGPALGDTVLDG